MHVLNLVNADKPFFRQQVISLQRQGVSCTSIMVPGTHEPTAPRSMTDYLRFFPQVHRALKQGQYDLVHANYGLTAPMALSQRRLPVVLTLWGTDLYGPYSWVSRACAPFCEDVVVMSPRMQTDLGQECVVIPHGVDLEQFQPMDRADARAAVGWEDDVAYVLFPYPLEREVKDFPRASRVVEAASDELGVPVRLEVVTGVPHEQFVAYLNAADCLLMTSSHEGSPNVVKEAMACNLPVVSTAVGDVPERLSGVTPSAVGHTDGELTEALVDVLDRGERSNGREMVRHISLDQTGGRLREVYEQAVQAR